MSRNNDAAKQRIGRRPLLRALGGGILGTTLAAGTTRASQRELPNTLAITKDHEGIDYGTASYQFAAGTELESISAEAGEVIDGNHAEGRVGPARGTDAYRFAGSVAEFSLDGDAAVFLNGDRIDPAVLANTIDIQSTAADRAFYEIVVSGRIVPGTDADLDGASHPDSVDDNEAAGSVAGMGGDTFHFSGELLELSVEQPSAAYVNGDLAQDLPNTLTIESTDEDRASYEVSVDGRIGAGFDADLTGATHPDSISGGTDRFVAERGTSASGSVAGGGTDSYWFSGEVTDLDVNGPAVVSINGEHTDAGSCEFEQLDFAVEDVSTEPSAVPPYSTVTGTDTNTGDEAVEVRYDLRFYEVDESTTNRLDEPRVATVASGETNAWELSTEALIDEDRPIEVIPYRGDRDC
jgi:hypothetical protein